MAADRILATYLIESPLPIAEAAEALAGEQSTGTFVPVPGETDELRQRFRARVERTTTHGTVDRPSLPGAIRPREAATYSRGEAVAMAMFAPVLRSHRVTVEQMAILEPVLTETVTATCLTVIREALDEAIRRGVPAPAARDFLMGHFNVEIAILFNEIDWEFSAGAKLAIEEAKKVLFQPDWKKVFEPERLRASVEKITAG